MTKGPTAAYKPILVAGTFDSKAEEHLFLKSLIESRGFPVKTMNLGTRSPSPFRADHDLFRDVIEVPSGPSGRDERIQKVLEAGKKLVVELHGKGHISAVISLGGGTGTHLATGIMRVLPLGVPKVMVSTVASRDMSVIVGTHDITMMHSVADILGVNSILGEILDRAAGAVCGMVEQRWSPRERKDAVALSMFGFITTAAEMTKAHLEQKGYEVVCFHANGTGGMAMEELAEEGRFSGILDLATHELADELKGGYCRGIGPRRFEPPPGRDIPRLVIPGGLDCAVLEFTRENIPQPYRNRKIFFYDFRSAVRLTHEETRQLARQLAGRLNKRPSGNQVLIPLRGWSEADREDGPLYDVEIRDAFIQEITNHLDRAIEVRMLDLHINDAPFAQSAAEAMDRMIRTGT